MDPVLRKFKDRVLFIKANLDAEAIASLFREPMSNSAATSTISSRKCRTASTKRISLFRRCRQNKQLVFGFRSKMLVFRSFSVFSFQKEREDFPSRLKN